jgi:bisphosphoglycerate-independent phosphoglycerate mutase (AlkP superfamily)
MDQKQFWQIIESAWNECPEALALRTKALAENDVEDIITLGDEVADNIADALTEKLYEIEREELEGFILQMEERLYHLDRRDIQERTEGAAEGFLYCRCFIVGMGEAYYNKADKDPSILYSDIEAECIGYLAYGVYADRYDEDFERNSKHNIATKSNKAGWKK